MSSDGGLENTDGPPAGDARSEPVAAREAATVLLVRDATAGVEVLLLERHPASRMAPGAFAFPGGRVEASDAPPDAERFCRGLDTASAAAVLRGVTPPERAIGFWVAALRELFEEAGLLLAYDPTGAPVVSDAEGGARLADARARCRAHGPAFTALLRAQGLQLATDRMAYWAHWITPEERPVRYDTRFFVAGAFAGGEADPDGVEVVGFRWLGSAAALAHHRAGDITLPAVTQEILASIAPYPTAAALLAAAPLRQIRPIRPRVVIHEGREKILLPDHPDWF